MQILRKQCVIEEQRYAWRGSQTTSLKLARKAKYYNINLTIDAEEADRLELSLVVLTKLARTIPT